jgi:hypothetical protein
MGKGTKTPCPIILFPYTLKQLMIHSGIVLDLALVQMILNDKNLPSMKNARALLGLVLIGCTTAVTAQTTTESTHSKHHKTVAEAAPTVVPPTEVQSAFQAKFSGDSAVWSKSPAGNYCATMMANGQKEIATFSTDGKWQSNKTDLTTDQLPDSAKTAIQTQFPGMEIATVQKLEYENVDPFFKVDLKQGDQSKSVMVNAGGYIQQ